MVRRFLQRLQKSVECRHREHVYLVDDEHLILSDLRRDTYLIGQIADILDRVVGSGIQFRNIVGTLFVKRPARLAFVASLARSGRMSAVDSFGEYTGT